MPLPCHGPQPCPSAPQGRSRDDHSGTHPPATQRCSFPPPFALSPPACVLCNRAEANPDLWGTKIEKQGLCVHHFCMVSSSPGSWCAGKICGPAEDTSCTLPGGVGLAGEALRLPLTGLLCSIQQCFVCRERGAAITCCWDGCDRSFHLPCAMEGECVTESFCREHRPEQEVEAALEENTECIICLESVEYSKSFQTLVCPTCKHAWFHRGCIQVGGHALSAGISFNCPHCRNEDGFLKDMLIMGIRVPLRLVSLQSCPSAVLSAWASASLRSWKLGRGEEQGSPASASWRSSGGSDISLSQSDCHRGRTSLKRKYYSICTVTVMLMSACVPGAGSTQRNGGKLPKRHPVLCTRSLRHRELEAEG
uniref:RING-type domain-containing protein n=1 Tax=Athene cunicularia TaxID=194338 RepID=A0A663N6S4_ATHCN